MKKCIAVFMVFALLMVLVLSVGAAAENEAVLPDEGEGAITGDVIGEGTVNADSAEQSWFAEVKTWVAENFSGLAVALAALYTVFPKWGGLWVAVGALKKVAALFAALKAYIDDVNNENSIYNVLKRQGNSLKAFMNDMAPLLEKLELDKQATVKLESTLEKALLRVEKMGGALGAVEEALELMASEFSDLISISTTVSQKRKAEMEADWMDKIEHLRNTVKEAAYVEQGEKENA